MLLVGILQDEDLVRLRQLLGPTCTLRATPTGADLKHALVSDPVDAVLLDPALLSSASGPPLSVLGQFSSVPLVLYTDLSPFTANQVIKVARLTSPRLILKRFEDDPAKVLRFLHRLPPARPKLTLLSKLQPVVERAAPVVQAAIASTFECVHDGLSIQQVAAASGLHRRTLERKLAEAGLPSLRRLMMAPRLLHAHYYLQDRAFSAKCVATKSRLANVRTLQGAADAMLGTRGLGEMGRLRENELVARLANSVRLHVRDD